MVRVQEWNKSGRKGWEVDIRGRLPDGTKYRERVRSPVSTYAATLRWAQQREAAIVAAAMRAPEPVKEERGPAPTLADFWPRYVAGHVKANMLKPSYTATVDVLYRLHLGPSFGAKRLDAIRDEDVQRFKGKLLADGLSAKYVNNIQVVLSKLLKTAQEWGVLERLPCRIRPLKAVKPEMRFLDFADYRRLADAAHALDPRIEIMVLLGGDAGLRRGEILALEWSDLDFPRTTINVQRSEWDGHVTAPKGGRSRRVPMTERLAATLQAHRHLRGPRVLCHEDGTSLGRKALHLWMESATRRANLGADAGLHVLRHTFCSHLAMMGVPAKAIQELAGHADLSTTLRYMHLSPGAKTEAIQQLDRRPDGVRGETGEKLVETSRNAVEH